MNSRDIIMKTLTPGDMFNQRNSVWRSISTLAQFASIEMDEVFDILDEHFQGLVAVRPNTKRPENGPLVALNEHVPPDEPTIDLQAAQGEVEQVHILAGNAVEGGEEQALGLDEDIAVFLDDAEDGAAEEVVGGVANAPAAEINFEENAVEEAMAENAALPNGDGPQYL